MISDDAAVTMQARIAALADFLGRHRRLLVLTGAGISTESGIPGYRDADGNWKGRKPIQHREYLDSHAVRQRYWARSMVGWPVVSRARPNAAHHALASLQHAGQVEMLVTQNVDGLHQAAGSTGVVELHGSIHFASCLSCGLRVSRQEVQHRLEARNPGFAGLTAAPAADGDARLERDDFDRVVVPDCLHCGGTLKPDVVFFGDSVPRERVEAVHAALARADALLVVGSSLMVYSGYRFCLAAVQQAKPIAALNLGMTRADGLLALKVSAPCGPALWQAVEALTGRTVPAGAGEAGGLAATP
ncbi:NAD-dependent protein deacetylase [Cupriavidus sp. AU9028]|uniref:NAD-dependent protein deacetylase n=1 Tax=Cupriavidus sp. AU9028 TaxID=2871157 RepID=UPI001C93E0E0|nr:NAD-dependent protein deacetylase [Cupriavidus sp. AU9028]MBY4896279.1 NAD-dependent protein deacetylase [Cupriavidus sp. AU9028]